jgi:O-antigen/teichoic acid export membrane protein
LKPVSSAPFARLVRFAHGRKAQTLLDQAIVSGSNFSTGILLVRGLGLVEFGKFTIAYSILLLALNVQLSFISAPMLSLGPLCANDAERRQFIRGIYGVQIGFSVAATIICAVAAVLFLWLRPTFGGMNLVLPFAVGVLFYLMQDWVRRYYFVTGKAIASVCNDIVSYVGQLIVLVILFVLHRLTLPAALWSIALTSGVAFALGAMLDRLGFSGDELKAAWQRCRTFSRDLAIANQLQWFVYQGAMLIGAGVLGAEAAGGVRATQNVVGPVNVAFQAMENLVPLRAGEEMRRGGVEGAAKFLFRFMWQGIVLLSVVFLLIGFFARDFLNFFYGHEVAVYTGILDLQMLYFMMMWPIRQLTFLFRTLNRTGAILFASAAAAAASLVTIYPFVRGFHTLGIMLAAVAGQVANLSYLAIAWLRTRTQAAPQRELEAASG